MAAPHSPTEIVEEIGESDEDLAKNEDDVKSELGRNQEMMIDGQRRSPGGRKARSKRGRNEGSASPDNSPGKRREAQEDLPVSGRELRQLLAGHLQTMKDEMRGGWLEKDTRINGVASEIKKDREESKRTKERVQKLEVAQNEHMVKIGGMEKEIAELKQGMAKGKNVETATKMSTDPWAQYLNARGDGAEPKAGDPPQQQPQGRELLSEEDRRTLIVGGWSQDTKKGTIVEEAKTFMDRPEVRALLDQDELLVWGPRRSFGALKFKPRGDEADSTLRDRMWGVIKLLRAAPQTLPSTSASNGGVAKNMWIQFVKTKEARKRSSHCSLLRRLCLELARGNISGGEAGRPEATEEHKYECDWGAGTVWFAEWKVGSSSHRAPRGESIKLLSSGWVDVQAVANLTGVTYVQALQAVEREINR